MLQNSPTQSFALTNTGNQAEISAAFVLRLTCDADTLNWRILLRGVNPEETRIFTNLESIVSHLETWMAKQILRFDEKTQSE